MSGKKKLLRELCEIARERGWKSYEHRSGGHIMFFHPDEEVTPVTTSLSASDSHWKENFKANLRQAERGIL